jgi:hypothetical protein
MKIDAENRISYGLGWVRERPDWTQNHPLGPVHWDVWDDTKTPLTEDVPANELQGFMVAKNLLVLW